MSENIRWVIDTDQINLDDKISLIAKYLISLDPTMSLEDAKLQARSWVFKAPNTSEYIERAQAHEDAMSELNLKLKRGEITQDEYDEQLREIQLKYGIRASDGW